MDKGKAIGIVVLSVVCCAVMALVETVVEPAYFVKSAIKAAVFLIIPLIFMKISGIKAFGGLSLPNKKAVFGLLLLGAGVYAAVMGAYLLTKARVDYSVLVASLTADQKVEGFLPVALYIFFIRQFLFGGISVPQFCVYKAIGAYFQKACLRLQLNRICRLPYSHDRRSLPAAAYAPLRARLGIGGLAVRLC